jgi:cytochrome c peroxidase
VTAALLLGLCACEHEPKPEHGTATVESTALTRVQSAAQPTAGENLAPRDPKPALAELGRLAFSDPSFSASGRVSCATCHNPAHAYGPPNDLAVQLGGPELKDSGLRAAPSLRYLRRTPIWTHSFIGNPRERLTETDHVPVGGLGWDGRFDSLAKQATFPLLAPNEMANRDAAAVVARVAKSDYAARFRELFGADVFANAEQTLAALGRALERFQLDDASFQPYDSKFDRYLEGQAALSTQEQHGFALFKDPKGGNCAACHIADRGANGAHPLFTDFSFAAIGVPRNAEIPANADPQYFDQGLCGPLRTDQTQEKKYCGMFKTPSLRNVAIRGALFHNGRFHSLEEALHFYVERDSMPSKWYPHPGKQQFDDLPRERQGNVDHITPPFTQHLGDKPVWSESDIQDVVAFLETLTDADAVPLVNDKAVAKQ